MTVLEGTMEVEVERRREMKRLKITDDIKREEFTRMKEGCRTGSVGVVYDALPGTLYDDDFVQHKRIPQLYILKTVY